MDYNNTQNVLQLFLKHLSERNLSELVKLFSDSIDWYIPGDQTKAPWLGKRNSRQQIAEFYEMLWQQTEPISVAIDHIYIDENKAVIAGAFSTKMLATNKITDSLFFIQLLVENDLIMQFRLLEDTLAVAQSLKIE